MFYDLIADQLQENDKISSCFVFFQTQTTPWTTPISIHWTEVI